MAEKEKEKNANAIIPIESIHRKIFEIREWKVMLDSDLAELYGVETRVLNQAVRRNSKRFPEDFMFRALPEEFEILKSQSVTSSSPNHGGRRKLPYFFTEQGVAMLSGVLNSERAIEVNIEIMRAFVNMRAMIAANDKIGKKLSEIEKTVGEHNEHFKKVFAALRLLMDPKSKAEKQIGFIRKSKA